MSDDAPGAHQPAAAAVGMPDKDDLTTSAATNTGTLQAHGGHEAPTFVAPSSYLRPSRAQPRPETPAKQMSAIDKEHIEGLVS